MQKLRQKLNHHPKFPNAVNTTKKLYDINDNKDHHTFFNQTLLFLKNVLIGTTSKPPNPFPNIPSNLFPIKGEACLVFLPLVFWNFIGIHFDWDRKFLGTSGNTLKALFSVLFLFFLYEFFDLLLMIILPILGFWLVLSLDFLETSIFWFGAW